MSEGFGLGDKDVRDKIIAVLCVGDIYAVCTPFCGSACDLLKAIGRELKWQLLPPCDFLDSLENLNVLRKQFPEKTEYE